MLTKDQVCDDENYGWEQTGEEEEREREETGKRKRREREEKGKFTQNISQIKKKTVTTTTTNHSQTIKNAHFFKFFFINSSIC